jgi:predicted kinase
MVTDAGIMERLDALDAWSAASYEDLRGIMAERKAGGYIRECHGDMHLGNMAEVDGEIVIFDGIEFSENLRWIDVMNEVAFLCTDLAHRGRPDFTWRFLNTYLEHSGDYPGVALLRYYQAYRAMVRAKVSHIRLVQPDLDDRERANAEREFLGYLGQAEDFARPAEPALVLTRGVSGSGKTVASQAVLESLGAIRVRSDVERKRLHGLPPQARSDSGPDQGLYTPEAGVQTYARLLEVARSGLEAGYPTVVDATFLQREQRVPFRQLAADLGVPYLLLDLSADRETLMDRVQGRYRQGADASEADPAVLQTQLDGYTALGADEASEALPIDSGDGLDPAVVAEMVRARLGR